MMIRHTVVFSLTHQSGSRDEKSFLDDAQVLASIPGVGKFEQLRQVSPESGFAFCFSMEFADECAYANYNAHPDHQNFVTNKWQPAVSSFQELDFISL